MQIGKKYYKNKLRELTQKFNVKVIDYLITDTLVLLLTSPDSMKILTGVLTYKPHLNEVYRIKHTPGKMFSFSIRVA